MTHQPAPATRRPFMRPATAIVILVLLLIIVIAGVVQGFELLSPPESVPSRVTD